MPFSEADKMELKESTLEVYEELFSTQIQFLTYDKNGNTADSEYYRERKYKLFLDPIPLSGRVRMTTDDELLTPLGVTQDWDATFTVPVRSLENGGILSLSMELILKSRIQYGGDVFKIVDFQPQSNVADIWLKYRIKGKKVVNDE